MNPDDEAAESEWIRMTESESARLECSTELLHSCDSVAPTSRHESVLHPCCIRAVCATMRPATTADDGAAESALATTAPP